MNTVVPELFKHDLFHYSVYFNTTYYKKIDFSVTFDLRVIFISLDARR